MAAAAAGLESRQELIRKSLDDAQEAKRELERLHLESAQILKEARVQADSIISQTRSDGERLREEMKQKARAEADTIVRTAERQIQLETARALQQIRHEAADLSVMIASKLIQRNLSKEDNERLIEDALKQVEGGNALDIQSRTALISASMWTRYFSSARRPAAVRRYSVRGTRPSNDLSHAMYWASSSLRAWTLRLPSVVSSRRFRSLNDRRSLTASALTMPRRSRS